MGAHWNGSRPQLFTNEADTKLKEGHMTPWLLYLRFSASVKFFDILEEVKKEEQTTIGDCCVCAHLKGEQSTNEYETS